MARYTGLTWDHPRGRDALERAAASARTATGEALIQWDVQPLEGFESAPIAETAARYDVIVLDHPHLGEALAHDALQPLDTLFDPEWIDALEGDSVGPSLASYRMDGHVWALPLDAATQVSVRRPEALADAPHTWDEVDELSRGSSVALSLAGPHAYLSFSSLCVALGTEPRTTPGAGYVDRDAGVEALERMTALAGRAPHGTEELNPIGLLDRMHARRDIDLIPLVYGYSTYAQRAGALAFGDAPAGSRGRPGSTIGGTGFAVSSRREVGDDLLAHLQGLLSPEAQRSFLPRHSGQPSRRAAWLDPEVNAASGDFYRSTLATIDQSWIRPRLDGFIAFQAAASALLRQALRGETSAGASLDRLDALFDSLAPDERHPR